MRALAVGDAVVVEGGYDFEPAWLAGREQGYRGRVIAFIPGQNDESAAVVELDEPVVLPRGAGAVLARAVSGRYLVLELGHVGATWTTPTPRIHVELCDFVPDAAAWPDRRQGAWIESHATYRIVE